MKKPDAWTESCEFLAMAMRVAVGDFRDFGGTDCSGGKTYSDAGTEACLRGQAAVAKANERHWPEGVLAKPERP